MKKVTLRFLTLHELSECMFQLGIARPEIDYEKYTLTAELSDKQIQHAKDCGGELIAISDYGTIE
jgi:hypothetical protein